MGHCPCEDLVSVKGKEQSCPECAAAWNKKQGKIPGVDPDAIEITTFGVYGVEQGGHHNPHYAPEESSFKQQEGHHAEPVKGAHHH